MRDYFNNQTDHLPPPEIKTNNLMQLDLYSSNNHNIFSDQNILFKSQLQETGFNNLNYKSHISYDISKSYRNAEDIGDSGKVKEYPENSTEYNSRFPIKRLNNTISNIRFSINSQKSKYHLFNKRAKLSFLLNRESFTILKKISKKPIIKLKTKVYRIRGGLQQDLTLSNELNKTNLEYNITQENFNIHEEMENFPYNCNVEPNGNSCLNISKNNEMVESLNIPIVDNSKTNHLFLHDLHSSFWGPPPTCSAIEIFEGTAIPLYIYQAGNHLPERRYSYN